MIVGTAVGCVLSGLVGRGDGSVVGLKVGLSEGSGEGSGVGGELG